MSRLVRTTRFSRGKLPHWEVEGGRYFVTVRCADSLPTEVVARLKEIHEKISLVSPASDAFVAEQRRYFGLMDRYLDAGRGACLLRESVAAKIVADEFDLLLEVRVEVPCYCLMPNHWHALLRPQPNCQLALPEIMKRLKGRTAKAIRQVFGGEGAFWQREWFDRWMRDDTEHRRTMEYIRNNPVKAGLVARWQEWPWTK
jgi:REP element-mobilizing transposase RayT